MFLQEKTRKDARISSFLGPVSWDLNLTLKRSLTPCFYDATGLHSLLPIGLINKGAFTQGYSRGLRKLLNVSHLPLVWLNFTLHLSWQSFQDIITQLQVLIVGEYSQNNHWPRRKKSRTKRKTCFIDLPKTIHLLSHCKQTSLWFTCRWAKIPNIQMDQTTPKC